jgi:hypothetical protein
MAAQDQRGTGQGQRIKKGRRRADQAQTHPRAQMFEDRPQGQRFGCRIGIDDLDPMGHHRRR